MAQLRACCEAHPRLPGASAVSRRGPLGIHEGWALGPSPPAGCNGTPWGGPESATKGRRCASAGRVLATAGPLAAARGARRGHRCSQGGEDEGGGLPGCGGGRRCGRRGRGGGRQRPRVALRGSRGLALAGPGPPRRSARLGLPGRAAPGAPRQDAGRQRGAPPHCGGRGRRSHGHGRAGGLAHRRVREEGDLRNGAEACAGGGERPPAPRQRLASMHRGGAQPGWAP
mmetsp:Transcript_46422/g.148205  ORF Transcript_46422/g.148205 Transcript_46422/m.148205 type:complete len:228 (+) Transcript_46422:104-787(+)